MATIRSPYKVSLAPVTATGLTREILMMVEQKSSAKLDRSPRNGTLAMRKQEVVTVYSKLLFE